MYAAAQRENDRDLPLEPRGSAEAVAKQSGGRGSELDFALASLQVDSEIRPDAKDYAAIIPADPKTEIHLATKAKDLSLHLLGVAQDLGKLLNPEPKKETPPLPNPLTTTSQDSDSAALQWTLRLYSAVGAAVSAVCWISGMTAASGVLAGAVVTYGLAALFSEDMRSWIGYKFGRAISSIKDGYSRTNEEIKASQILSKINEEIRQGRFTDEEKPDLIGELVKDLKLRSALYSELASKISAIYSEQRETRHELIRDQILQTTHFAEKAAVKKSLPPSIRLNISEVTQDLKLAEELSAFLQQHSNAQISRPGGGSFSTD